MIEHIDRVPTNPGRVQLTPVQGQANTYDIVRADEPTQIGNPINKAVLDEFLAASGVTEGTADALKLEQAGFDLTDGATVRFRTHIDVNKGATLNVSGTGAKPIVDALGKAQKVSVGSWATVIYSAANGNFILQGSGGGALRFGNAPGQISTFELYSLGHGNPYYGR